jgi:mitochondrial fission protein ELM1
VSPSDQQPSIWLLLGDKKGDNGQVETIAEALQSSLGWHSELKRIKVLEPFVFGKAKVGPTLYHIDRERTAPLEPPWPDLVITVGRSPANVALWVREQSAGHTRIVLVGKPSGMMERFALIVISTEILLAPYPNVLRISMPLMRIDEAAVQQAAKEWRPRFEALARPLVAIMIGGPTNPFVYNHSVTTKLIEAANRICDQGGTPYITTSRRTPAAIVERLKQDLPEAARLFEWQMNAAENPYMGLLGLADRFIVTGDSISMMVEVTRLGKPLEILPLPCGLIGTLDQLRRSLARWLFNPGSGGSRDRLRAKLARLVYHSRFIRHTRHYPGFHQKLVDLGLATWFGQASRPPSGHYPDDVSQVVRRIQALAEEQVRG